MLRNNIFVLGMILSFPWNLQGADPAHQPEKQIYTDINDTDEDFRFQGEFLIKPKSPATSQWGLQVVALGNSSFSGLLYPGGLPGAGWAGTTKIPLTGTREKQSLSLKGEHVEVTWNNYDSLGRLIQDGTETGAVSRTKRKSPSLGLTAPQGGTVLFDGTNTDHFVNGRITDDGLLMEGSDFKKGYQNFRLHLEFRLPYMPLARGQARGNSGVYLQSRYEVQILDSFGLEGVFNECGALYRYIPPKVNMCFPPLTWQTYDIDFQSALFDETGKKIRNLRLTVWHNGVKVHDAIDVERKTGAGKPEGAMALPIRLQNHKDPVRFRNIWIVDFDEVPRENSVFGSHPPMNASLAKGGEPIIPPVPLEVLRAHSFDSGIMGPVGIGDPGIPGVGFGVAPDYQMWLTHPIPPPGPFGGSFHFHPFSRSSCNGCSQW